MPRRPIRDPGLPDHTYFFEDLTGGVDLVSSPTTLAPNRAQELLNFSVQEPGALNTVEGFAQFTATPLTTGGGANRIQGGERVYLEDGATTLTAYEGAVRAVTDAGVFGSTLITGLNGVNEIYFPHNHEVVLVFDGASAPKISANGTTFYDVGIAAPGTAPTLGTSSGGSLIDTDTYEVSYTYGTTSALDPDLVHESNGSPTATQAVASPNLTITVQGPSSSDPKVNRVYVYARNTTTGQTLRRRVADVANGGTWSTSFSVEPSGLALSEPIGRELPPNFSYGVFHRNRWWALHPTIPNRLHLSEVFQPQTWPANFFIDFPLIRGDSLSALVPLGDLLVVFGQTGVYILGGDTTFEIDVRPALNSETGAFGPRAALKVEAGIVHAGVGGVFLFNGANDAALSEDIETGWRDLVSNATPTDLSRVALNYRSTQRQVQIAVPRLFPTGSPGEYVVDLIRTRQLGHPAWFRTPRSIGGYLPWSGNEALAGNHGRIFSWPPTGGLLNEERTGTDANGSDIVAVFTTPEHHTQFRETMLVTGFVDYQPSSGSLLIELVVSGQLVSAQTIDVSATLAEYGSAEYGLSSYGGGGRRKTPLAFPLPADGTEFYFRFTYTGQNLFKMFSYGFGSVPEPVIRTL